MNWALTTDTSQMLKDLVCSQKRHLEDARRMFEGTGITITVEGRTYPGAAVGTHTHSQSSMSRRRSLDGSRKWNT